jgi:hypothetical protein
MLMLLAALVMLAAASASPAPARDMPVISPNAGQPATCPAISRYHASRRGKTPQAKKLGELPDADVYATVYRRVGGCETPIIVKYGVAGG